MSRSSHGSVALGPRVKFFKNKPKFGFVQVGGLSRDYIAQYLPIKYAWMSIFAIVACAALIAWSAVYVNAGMGVAALILMMILVLRLGAKTPECNGNPFKWMTIFWDRNIRGYRMVVTLKDGENFYFVVHQGDVDFREDGSLRFGESLVLSAPAVFFSISHSPTIAQFGGWQKRRKFVISKMNLRTGECFLEVTDDEGMMLSFNLLTLLRIMPTIDGFTKLDVSLRWSSDYLKRLSAIERNNSSEDDLAQALSSTQP
jgi:hypothetical protein